MDNHLLVRAGIPRYKKKESEKGIQDLILLDNSGYLTPLLNFEEDFVFDSNGDEGNPDYFMIEGINYRQERARYNKEEISASAIGQNDIHIGFRSGKLVTVSRNGEIKRTWSPVPDQDSDNRFWDLYRNENMTISADELTRSCAELRKLSPEFLERQRRFEEQRLFSQDSFYERKHSVKDILEDGNSLYVASPYGLFVFNDDSKKNKQIVERKIVEGNINGVIKSNRRILYVSQGDSVLARARGEKINPKDQIKSLDGKLFAKYPSFGERDWCEGYQIQKHTLYFIHGSGNGSNHYSTLIARNLHTGKDKNITGASQLGGLQMAGPNVMFGRYQDVKFIDSGNVKTMWGDIPREICGKCKYDSEHGLIYWNYNNDKNETTIKTIGGEDITKLQGLALFARKNAH